MAIPDKPRSDTPASAQTAQNESKPVLKRTASAPTPKRVVNNEETKPTLKRAVSDSEVKPTLKREQSKSGGVRALPIKKNPEIEATADPVIMLKNKVVKEIEKAHVLSRALTSIVAMDDAQDLYDSTPKLEDLVKFLKETSLIKNTDSFLAQCEVLRLQELKKSGPQDAQTQAGLDLAIAVQNARANLEKASDQQKFKEFAEKITPPNSLPSAEVAKFINENIRTSAELVEKEGATFRLSKYGDELSPEEKADLVVKSNIKPDLAGIKLSHKAELQTSAASYYQAQNQKLLESPQTNKSKETAIQYLSNVQLQWKAEFNADRAKNPTKVNKAGEYQKHREKVSENSKKMLTQLDGLPNAKEMICEQTVAALQSPTKKIRNDEAMNKASVAAVNPLENFMKDENKKISKKEQKLNTKLESLKDIKHQQKYLKRKVNRMLNSPNPNMQDVALPVKKYLQNLQKEWIQQGLQEPSNPMYARKRFVLVNTAIQQINEKPHETANILSQLETNLKKLTTESHIQRKGTSSALKDIAALRSEFPTPVLHDENQKDASEPLPPLSENELAIHRLDVLLNEYTTSPDKETKLSAITDLIAGVENLKDAKLTGDLEIKYKRHTDALPRYQSALEHLSSAHVNKPAATAKSEAKVLEPAVEKVETPSFRMR